MIKHYKSLIAGSILLILPFLVEPGLTDEIRVPKVKAIIFFAGMFGATLIYRHIRKSLAFAFGWCVCSAVLSGLGPQFQLNVLVVIASAVLLSYLVTDINKFEVNRVLGFLVLAGIGNGIMGYLQMTDHDPFFYFKEGVDKTLPVGFLGQQTLYGPFMASCVIAALFRRNYYCALFILVPCLATNSSFTFASLGCGLTVWVYSQVSRRLSYFMVGMGALSVPVLYHFFPYSHLFDATGRFEIWKPIFQEAMNKKFFGHGLGTFLAYVPYIEPEAFYKLHGLYKQVHNDFLELFFDTGLVGVSCAVYMLYDFFKRAWEQRDNKYVMACVGILVVYLMDGMGNFPFRLSPQGLIALFAWVMVVTHKRGGLTFEHT